MTESFLKREQQIPFGMLVGQDIAFLIQEKQIIQNCVPANLKKAVYEMRLGSFAFRWEGDKRQTMCLGNQQNKEKELTLPPNSLTFVTTLEKFNLPDYIIARFNLKVDWVLRGLLLGTGPIVNPGFDKYLLIPIHNFSSRNVQIGYGKKLIAVEFTKIPLDEKKDFDFKLQSIEEDVETFVEPYSKEAMFVESSVYRAIQKTSDKTAKSKKYRNVFTWIGAIALFGVFATIMALVFTALSFNNDTQQRLHEAQDALFFTRDKLEKENTKIQNELAVLKEQFKMLSTPSPSVSSETRKQINTDSMKVAQQENPEVQPSPLSEEKDINTSK